MSDIRRRRKKASGGEESESDLSETETKAPVAGGDHPESEYESADDQINSPNNKKEKHTELDETHSHDEDIDEEGDEGGGEGEESAEDDAGELSTDGEGYSSEEEGGEEGEEGVDDDDDKKNPQYIPKKGMFYEHDDRLGTDEEEEAAKEDKADPPKRVWKADIVERWGHDKFKEFDQEPKSKDELVASYGYDIRNEDSAPRARRRRRYGRGPNKYTRNWEDENAYGKAGGPAGGVGPRKPKIGAPPGDKMIEDEEEFPALGSKKPAGRRERDPRDMKDQPPAVQQQQPLMTQKNRRGGGGGGMGDRDRRSDMNDNGPHQRRDRGDDRRGGGGGRGQSRGGPPRGRGRGGDRGGGFNRGGYEDRRRQERFLDRNHDDRRVHTADDGGGFGGRGGGRGGRGGGGYGDNRSAKDRRVQDQSVIVRPEDLGEDLGKIDINRENDTGGGGRGKRYSAQRRGGGGANLNAMTRDPHSMSPEVHRSAAARELYEDGINPAMCSGPPRGAPFQQPPAQTSSSAASMNRMAAVTSAVSPTSISSRGGSGGGGGGGGGPPATFIPTPPQPILTNYQNSPPVQFSVPASGPAVTHLGVPVPPTAALPPGIPGGPPILAAAPGFANGPPPPPEAVLIAAAAAGSEGFAAVRGGVTYFNPTAQNVLPQRPVSKRPKAAIPIVDPAVVESTSANNTGAAAGAAIQSDKVELTAGQHN